MYSFNLTGTNALPNQQWRFPARLRLNDLASFWFQSFFLSILINFEKSSATVWYSKWWWTLNNVSNKIGKSFVPIELHDRTIAFESIILHIKMFDLFFVHFYKPTLFFHTFSLSFLSLSSSSFNYTYLSCFLCDTILSHKIFSHTQNTHIHALNSHTW